MAFGYKKLNVSSDYGANDPGANLTKNSIGTKVLQYVKRYPNKDEDAIMKALFKKERSHWTVFDAFRKNKLFEDAPKKYAKKIKVKTKNGTYEQIHHFVEHHLTLSKKGEKYLEKALERGLKKTTKAVVNKKNSTKQKVSKKK